MQSTAPPLGKYAVSNLGADQCEFRWPDFEAAIDDAFRGARFMPGFDARSPLTHTLAGFADNLRDTYRHVVVETDDRLLGASFRVPAERPGDVLDADPGWFFIARDLPGRVKIEVADALVAQSHQLMRMAGFTRVVTNMGTYAGAALLRRRHGYQPVPPGDQHNRWVHEL
jgi:hypothetical protein